MDEQYQAEQERENLSGADDFLAWMHEQSMRTEIRCDMDDDKNKELKDVQE
jgi:hypothetical protein